MLQLCEYMTGTMHGQGLARLFRPTLFCAADEHADGVRKAGSDILLRGFELVAPLLSRGPFLFDHFMIDDASLFYLELHAARLGIGMPDPVRSHLGAMLERPSGQGVMEREHLSSPAVLADQPARPRACDGLEELNRPRLKAQAQRKHRNELSG